MCVTRALFRVGGGGGRQRGKGLVCFPAAVGILVKARVDEASHGP